ncbi:hypothetical protein MLD38_010578 [Melastoma candidum]|uniref:Uncharacterized protein n=1 Tax=Melastoma candidum TaxID=119954 RepID=A0ACB9R3D8_9MYRT|nr:hypothetical protein MLD38_010578 [Melastoma candidum]
MFDLNPTHVICSRFYHQKSFIFSPQINADARHNLFPAKVCNQTSGTLAAKTLSWHLAYETKSTLRISQQSDMHSLRRKPAAAHTREGIGLPAYSTATSSIDAGRKESLDGSKPLTTFKSFNSVNWNAIPPRKQKHAICFPRELRGTTFEG